MSNNDLQLLDNVELRFALAESDAQLEKTLNTFLCPMLLKLASPAENVRAKVISILTHINKRVRPKPSIKLPVTALLQQFSTSSSLLVKNFALIYIEMGYERLPSEEKLSALPQLIKEIARRPVVQQTTLIHMVLPSLSSVKQYDDGNTEADPYGFEINPQDAICLLQRFQDVLLYRQPIATYDGKAPWAATSELKNIKVSDAVGTPATGDAYHEVSGMGEDALKRIKLPDLEEKAVVNRIYQMYQGSNNGRSTSGPKTNMKLVMAGMAFVQWIARMSSQASLEPIAPILVSGLLKYTREHEATVGIESESAKGFAYVALSLISKRVPDIFRKDLSIVEGLFDQLESQPASVKTYIQEAICTMLDAFKPVNDWASDVDIARIVSIIEANAGKEEHQARFCAIRYANGLFPFADISSKYICLAAIADDKLEIREEAKRGLAFPSARILDESSNAGKGSALPDFAGLLQLISIKSRNSQKQSEEMHPRPTYGKSFVMGFSLEVFIHMLQFFRRLLITGADPDVIIEESSNEYELQQFVFTPTTRTRPFVGSPKSDSRHAVAHIIGIIGTDDLGSVSPQQDVLRQLLRELHTSIKDTTKQTSPDQRHGSILAIGFIIGRLLYRYSAETYDIVPESELREMVKDIVKDLDSKQNMFVSGACIALGEIGRYGVVPSQDVRSIILKLIEAAKETKDIKTLEHAIASLGHIGVGNSDQVPEILSFLYDFGPKQTKQTEVNFTIGEAIACIGAGWRCSVMDVFADVADKEPSQVDTPISVMDGILNNILKDMGVSPRAATKKATSIWLLSLVKFCSTHPSVKAQLQQIHSVFSNLLSDRDELTQEVASKGIGLVYELGDQSLRNQLVGSLVGMFGEGKRAATKITGDTELFDNNALGQAPDGSSLSTYQSILSLASDMNQPELVYKFMHLASHNSLWESRKGAAFGFSSIVSQAEEELKPHLATLIPRLYRYQYDPNPKVNEAMTSIWRALVKEPKKAVQEYFDVIINDLLEGMGARAWRTRESSCLAMTDLLQGRSVSEIEKYLEKIWTMSFRTLDDIKESVRAAAFKTCRALTLMTVKYCDPKHVSSTDGQRVLSIMIPFLVQKGLLSSADEVSKFSLSTILKICKQAGSLLRSHIPTIVIALLDGLTTMEPQLMNYLSFHTDKYQVSQEQLEGSRLNAVKLSPMMEGIDSCLENVDDTVMPALSDQIVATIKRAVGLPTKAGCAHLLVSLCIKKPAIVREYSDTLLKALGSAIKDKSPAVRKSYAVAVGYLARVTTDGALVKFIERLDSFYLDTEEEELRSISAITTREISKNASDRFKSVASAIMPTVFYGTFDTNKDISGVWNDVWEEHTAGSSAAVKLYAPEIVDLLSKQLKSASWNAKKQSAMALKAMSEVKDLTESMGILLPLVLDGLSGRTWQGKEQLVELLPALVLSSKQYFVDKASALQDIAKVLVRESKKTNKQYRRYAIDALGKFLDGFPDMDYYTEVKAMLFSVLEDEEDNDGGDDDGHDKPLQLMVMASAAKALGMAWTRNEQVQRQDSAEFVSHVSKALARNVWNVRSALLEALEKFWDKLDLSSPPPVISEGAILLLLDSLLEGSLRDFKYISLRNQGLQLLKKLIGKVKGSQANSPVVYEKLTEVLDVLKKDPIPSISETAAVLEAELKSSIAMSI
ncbi:hypothetical protein BGX34_004264 [Mortierella sp. NVP85]|nr:hypothetical protein BGX34_004264 [Mortierella sp. NVP85]